MRTFLHFLSGEVPGGVLLLFFIVLVINLSLFYLYNSSKLFSKEVYKRKAIRSNIFVLGIYLVLWIFLEPPRLPERVMILPFQNNEEVDFRLAEAVQMRRRSFLRAPGRRGRGHPPRQCLPRAAGAATPASPRAPRPPHTGPRYRSNRSARSPGGSGFCG